MTKLDSERLKTLHSQGKSNRELAREFNVHHNTIAYNLKKLGLNCNTANQPIDIISETEARCKKCAQVKPLKEFQFGRRGQKYEYKFSYCNTCRKKQVYLNLNQDVNKFLSNSFNRLKLRAKKNNIPFSLTKNEFIKQYYDQDGKCFYSDEKLICEVGSSLQKNSLSVDKLIPDLGYVSNNFVFATHRINTCKNDLSLEEIKKWMPLWYSKIQEVIEI